MKRKNFWILIIGIAVLCIIIPAASGAYNSLNKKSGNPSVEKPADKSANEENDQDKSENASSQPEENREQPAHEEYTVKAGDNLWEIAQKFQTSVESIKELNNLSENDLIPGQVLTIPSPGTQLKTEETTPSRSLDSRGRYVVQDGDSLWIIAEKLQISVDALRELNGLTGDQLRPGQTLQVSGEASLSNRQADQSTPAAEAKQDAPAPEQKTDPAPQPKSGIVETARQYLGASYVYGGSSPSGFDCSGFDQYVYKQHGISLPRVAGDQANVGTRVDSPAPGDLVFFTRAAGSGEISHVGIYIGNNTFIHARNKENGVTSNSLDDSSNYGKRFAGANRI